MLNGRALKGVAFEAVRTGLREDETLWSGIANEAEHRGDPGGSSHRRGAWHAVVELARASQDYPHVWVCFGLQKWL